MHFTNTSFDKEDGTLDPKFLVGVWPGLRMRTDEALIGTIHGVVRARSVRRRAPEAQWNQQAAVSMLGPPREPVPGAGVGDHTPARADFAARRIRGRRDGRQEEGGAPGAEPPAAGPDRGPTDAEDGIAEPAVVRPKQKYKFKVVMGMLDKCGVHGFCPACRQINEGRAKFDHHSDACRDRVLLAIESDPESRAKFLRTTVGQRLLQEAVEQDIEAKPELRAAHADHDVDLEQAEQLELFGPDGDDDEDLPQPKRPRTMPPPTEGPAAASSSGSQTPADSGIRSPDTSTEERQGDRQERKERARPEGRAATVLWKQQSYVDANPLPFGKRDFDLQGSLLAVGTPILVNMVELNSVDVSEAYRGPRVVSMAEETGLTGGSSMDLTTVDERGMPWDFGDVRMRSTPIEG